MHSIAVRVRKLQYAVDIGPITSPCGINAFRVEARVRIHTYICIYVVVDMIRRNLLPTKHTQTIRLRKCYVAGKVNPLLGVDLTQARSRNRDNRFPVIFSFYIFSHVSLAMSKPMVAFALQA